MRCPNCGCEAGPEGGLCPACSAPGPQGGESGAAAPEAMDVSSWLENAASFLIPALGLVLLCCAAGERPLKAREIGRFALAGFACDTALLVAAYCRLLALYPG